MSEVRLIDANALLARVDEERKYLIARGQTGAEHILVHNFRDLIDNAPTVEPQKVVTIPHELIEKLVLCVVDTVESIDWNKAIEAYKARPQGEWIKNKYPDGGYNFTCANCSKLYADNPDYCPNCGAQMVGGKEE